MRASRTIPPGIPRPLPDELLYSLIARSAKYLGEWSPKKIIRAVYGRKNVLACPDLPSSVGSLSGFSEEAWELTTGQLLIRHTLVGYYTHYLGESTQNRVLVAMHGIANNLHLALGICASNVVAPSRFRLCPCCVEDDLLTYGETYWRRAHHVPGVLVCPRHAHLLHECELPFRPPGRHEHVAAHPRMLERQSSSPLHSTVDMRIAAKLSSACASLLDCPAVPGNGFHDWRPALHSLGYVGRQGGQARMSADFRDYFGDGILSAMFKAGQSGDRLAWLNESRRKPRRHLHPLKHVMLDQFIKHRVGIPSEIADSNEPRKSWGIFRDEARRELAARLSKDGLTTHAIARKFNVDWKTASRLLAPLPSVTTPINNKKDIDQRLWVDLVETNRNLGRTELRELAPALYARLYRSQRNWLMQIGAGTVRTKGVNSRVDWSSRDSAVAKEVREEISRVLSLQPAVRASRNRVLGVLRRRALVAHYASKLPQTIATLDSLCESVEAFQIRRTEVEIKRSAGAPLARWSVLKNARINTSRMPDHGSFIFKRALSNVQMAARRADE